MTDDVHALADHLFRRSAGRMVASLTRALGADHLDLAEEVVQEALAKALHVWPFKGVPDDPEAWLLAVARNLALDHLRRGRRWRDKAAALAREWPGDAIGPDERRTLDDELALVVMTCHPLLALEDRVALTLKTAAGFSVGEIARALLKKPAAVAQRLVRAKRRLRDARVSIELPAARDLAERLEAVLEVLYLLFNEGYAATGGGADDGGGELLRPELCREAIRLAELLAARPETDRPALHALLALFRLQAARFPARRSAAGELVTLAEQDRSLWSREEIARGLGHLDRAARGRRETPYHLEAAIAAAHAVAPSYEATDWPLVLSLYDRLLAAVPSPVVALNRLVALAEIEGPAPALGALEELAGRPDAAALERYHLRWAVEGDLRRRAGDPAGAASALERALTLGASAPERRLLERRLSEARRAQPPGSYRSPSTKTSPPSSSTS